MAPVESKPVDLFDKVWQFDLAQNVISIGWKQLGDVTAMTRDDLAEAVARTYPNKPSQTILKLLLQPAFGCCVEGNR